MSKAESSGSRDQRALANDWLDKLLFSRVTEEEFIVFVSFVDVDLSILPAVIMENTSNNKKKRETFELRKSSPVPVSEFHVSGDLDL